MSMTDVNQVSALIQKYWSPMFTQELRESLLLGSLVNKDYQGEIKEQGDTVKVSQINHAAGALKTVGTDADTFDSELVSSTQISIQANKRAVAAYEIADLAQLQSQLGAEDSEIRASLLFAVGKQINDYLYSLVNPSTSNPAHLLNSTSTMDAATVASIRKKAAQAKWLKNKGWYALLDPAYYSDILNQVTLTNSQYVPDAPVVAGQVSVPRFGFNLLEDNSRGASKGLFFHPDFMHLVMQQQVRFKLSDLHSQKKFGYLLSCDIVFGASLGIDGAKKHIFATAAASGADAS